MEIESGQIPWISQKLFNRETVTLSSPEDLPAEAGADKDFLRAKGSISLSVIPLFTEDRTLGAMSLSTVGLSKTWSQDLIRQCRLIAEVFTNAMMAEAKKSGWTVVSIKADWNRIYPDK